MLAMAGRWRQAEAASGGAIEADGPRWGPQRCVVAGD